MRFLLLLLLISLSVTGFSQIDSTYIGFFDYEVSVKGYFSKNFLMLTQETGPDKEKTYIPNNPVNLGAGFSWNNTSLSFGYGYGFDFTTDKELGKTKAFDFQFHHYNRNFAVDVFIQKYSGYYVEEDDSDKSPGLCPDLKIQQYGLNAQYVFNSKKFSYKAAFDQSQKQLKSAGSILLGVGVSQTKIDSDSSFYYNEKNNLRNFQFGVSGGYTYTWVIDKRFYVNGSITAGIHFGSESIGRFGKQKLEVYPAVLPRISAGFNKKSWSLGLNYVGTLTFPSYSKQFGLLLHSGCFQIGYIKRFTTGPFGMKKPKILF